MVQIIAASASNAIAMRIYRVAVAFCSAEVTDWQISRHLSCVVPCRKCGPLRDMLREQQAIEVGRPLRCLPKYGAESAPHYACNRGSPLAALPSVGIDL